MSTSNKYQPEITSRKVLGIQVCVPKDYSDEVIEQFANDTDPTGISSNWQLVEDGDPSLGGDPASVPCEEREGCVHRVLVC